MKAEKPLGCSLCNRGLELHFHHLVPKKMHEKRKILALHDGLELIHYGAWLCVDCHKTIHRKISHYDLATKYYTIEKLLEHPEICKFVTWASRQHKKIKRS